MPTHTGARPKAETKSHHTQNLCIFRIFPPLWIKSKRFWEIVRVVKYTLDKGVYNGPLLEYNAVDCNILGGHSIEQPLKDRAHPS